MHVVIASGQQCIAQRSKDPRLVVAEIIGRNQVQCCAGLRLVVVMPMRVVPAATVFDLIRGQAEQEEIVLAGLLGHLDRRAVAGAERQCPVHHEFHVAGAAGFITGSRDLVRDIGGRDQPFSQ